MYVALPLMLIFGPNAQASQDQPQMLLQTESPESFPKTVDIFKQEVTAAGWSILNATNLAGILSEKGYTLSPVLIFDVCSGKYSSQILAKDEYRFVTPLMPCRMSIYQTSKGEVIIARLNAKGMAQMFDGELAKIMMKSNDALEGIIQKTISRLKESK
jgi:uncharacterized protein (DUF302 family)